MSRPNTKLWGSLLPGGTAGETAEGGIDTIQVIDNLLWTLHAATRDELTFWTEADLIQWMDEALKRLARVACVFVGRDVEILTVASQATYTLPERHVSTLHISHVDRALRPSGTLEMEALDAGYQTTAGSPDYWYEDLQGGLTFGLAPVPDASDEALPLIYEGWPETLDAGRQQTLVAAPAPLKGYLTFSVLASAYGTEGEAETPDIAAHCRSRVAMYDQIFQDYYGKGV